MKDWLKLWPIPITLIAVVALLYVFGKLGSSESYNVVLGIALGVVMGFLVDLAKRSIDDFYSNRRLRQTVGKLLEQDAKSLFRLFEMYKELVASKNHPSAPPGIETVLPPDMEMTYWRKLTERNDVLDLAAETPFDSWFRQFSEYARIKDLMESLPEDMSKATVMEKNKYRIALVICRDIITKNSHEKLLRLFLTKDEMEAYKKNWKNEFKD